jgi:hypothetical protein
MTISDDAIRQGGAIRITCALPKPADSEQKVSDEFTAPLCRAHHRESRRSRMVVKTRH